MANEGAAVVVSGRNREEGEAVVAGISAAGGSAIFVATDVSQESDCVNLIDSAVRTFGQLDILVNNAGIFPIVQVDDITVEAWDNVFAVNVRGPFLCSRAALQPMRVQGGGVIINVGSVTAYNTAPSLERLLYGTSKAALLTMTKKMAHALLSDRVRVNWVTVGWIATPGEIALRGEVAGDGERYLREIAGKAPLGRLETVEETAEAIIYLASDAASHITGCELNISGGLWI